MKKIILSVIVLVVLILTGFVFDWGKNGKPLPDLNNAILATSTMHENASSTSDIPIEVSYPVENQEVSSPIKIAGKARGNWFFEATFPIQLVDSEGNIITTTQGRAQGDWATTSFVNFTAELDYNKASSTGPALIVLSNDNPSGNPAFDKSIYIPVVLK